MGRLIMLTQKFVEKMTDKKRYIGFLEGVFKDFNFDSIANNGKVKLFESRVVIQK